MITLSRLSVSHVSTPTEQNTRCNLLHGDLRQATTRHHVSVICHVSASFNEIETGKRHAPDSLFTRDSRNCYSAS